MLMQADLVKLNNILGGCINNGDGRSSAWRCKNKTECKNNI